MGNTTPPPAVTGVPEPEEWLLLGLALATLGWVVYKQRRETAVTLRNGANSSNLFSFACPRQLLPELVGCGRGMVLLAADISQLQAIVGQWWPVPLQ